MTTIFYIYILMCQLCTNYIMHSKNMIFEADVSSQFLFLIRYAKHAILLVYYSIVTGLIILAQ
jgi:hypothetical protein